MSVLAPGRNIVLIGMMGAGKSAVGRILADRLERPFVDTDELVEAEVGKPVERIFAEDGERTFRDLEAMVIRHVATTRGQVVSVGGGAVLNPANVTTLRATGDLVWLDATPEVLAERVGEGADRPLLAGADDVLGAIRGLHDRRHNTYRKVTATRVDTSDRRVDDVASDVLAWARRRAGLLARDERDVR